MSAHRDRAGRWASFECPIADCGFAVSGNLGQEPDDAISHIEDEHWTDDLTDAERELLVADARALGFDPVGPNVVCFCGGEHITGSCLDSGGRESE